MRYRWKETVLAALLAFFAAAAPAAAQSGTTLTPDRLSFMVNKDVGAERWTINVNLHSTDPDDISNLTGNVFKSDGSPPSFILCQVRPDSEGSLSDPGSELRLQCRGTGPCESSAQRCSRNDWGEIPGADDIRLPASFFLPPGGLAAAASADESGAASEPGERPAQANDRGATLSFDNLNVLVNKDVSGERWSISLNFLPVLDAQGLVQREITSVTGNVIRPGDAAPPAFLYCTEREDSAGTLADPASTFRFTCQAMDACPSTAEECAESSWQTIADDVALPASFFLPPDGLTGGIQSDPELVILGRTSGPPTIVTGDFQIAADGASAATAGRAMGSACAVGSPCIVAQVGSCSSVSGEVLLLDDGRCGCALTEIAAGCVLCGGSACGESCEFPVGGATARGFCLPFTSNTATCACFPIGAGQIAPAVGSCAGPLGATCPTGACCADDPVDGCSTAGGDVDCPGVCVEADCPGGAESCGICLAGPECGNGNREAGEECDGSDLRNRLCIDFGFFGGDLACDDSCLFDFSECDGPTVTPGPCKTGTCQ